MLNVRPVGKLWDLDAEGFILNDAALGKIKPPYDLLARSAGEVYLKCFGERVRGVYVRGTVARGAAMAGVSDFDGLALIETSPEEQELSRLAGDSERLERRYPFVTGVGLDAAGSEEVWDGERFSELALEMATQAVCVWGEDVIPALPVYRPGVLVANNDVAQIGRDVESALAEVRAGPSPENVRYWCRRAAKNVVRAGHSLTLPRARRFTRDLYPCYRGFARAYPEKEPSMRRAVEYALEPSPEVREVVGFLKGFGAWVSEEAEGWLQRYNPSRELALRLGDFPEEVRFSWV